MYGYMVKTAKESLILLHTRVFRIIHMLNTIMLNLNKTELARYMRKFCLSEGLTEKIKYILFIFTVYI
jgi:hypothetical protein